jgi:hypothetical protein
MTEETRGARGEAAYREQREAIASRNADTRKRGKAERELRNRAIAARDREHVESEAEQLRALNDRIQKRAPGGLR